MMEKRIFVSLDIAKYVMAVLILLGHTANEWAHLTGFWHYALSCSFTVPVFFVISGFLFFTKIKSVDIKEQNAYYKKWSYRVGKMYLIWSCVYFCFVLMKWSQTDFILEDIVAYIHRSLVYSTYATIWFLPALWVGISILYCLQKTFGAKTTFVVMVFIWLFGVFGGAYYGYIPKTGLVRNVFNGYIDYFLTFRNGLFFGSVYSYVGYLVYKYYNKFTLKHTFLLVLFFQLINCVEIILIKRVTPDADSDMGITMLPLAFSYVVLFLHISLKNRPIYMKLRNQSMLIFCGQRLFLTAIPSVFPLVYSNFICNFSHWEIMIVFVVQVLLFSYVIDKLSIKFPILKKLR